MKNYILTLSFSILLSVSGYAQIKDSTKTDTVKEKPIQITAVGDIMLGTHYPNRSYLPRNVKSLWNEAIPYFHDTDVLFGNLEGSFLDKGEPSKKCTNPKICYVFKMPTKYASEFKHAGFNLLSMANNHVGDFGGAGKLTSRRLLDSLNIAYAGLLEKKTCIIEKNGISYGMAAFAPNRGTVNLNNTKQAVALVKKLKEKCDIVIVSFHGGAEGAKYQHITRKKEFYIGENRGNVYKFARDVIDAGADLVFGHGPHVTRTIDLYKNRFIIYSLGNFCTYGRFNLRGPNGLAPMLKVFINNKGEFLNGKIVPFIQVGRGGVKYDSQNKVIKKIQNLLRTDIPEANLKISDDGTINIK